MKRSNYKTPKTIDKHATSITQGSMVKRVDGLFVADTQVEEVINVYLRIRLRYNANFRRIFSAIWAPVNLSIS